MTLELSQGSGTSEPHLDKHIDWYSAYVRWVPLCLMGYSNKLHWTGSSRAAGIYSVSQNFHKNKWRFIMKFTIACLLWQTEPISAPHNLLSSCTNWTGNFIVLEIETFFKFVCSLLTENMGYRNKKSTHAHAKIHSFQEVFHRNHNTYIT
jgi:hypothetical protein